MILEMREVFVPDFIKPNKLTDINKKYYEACCNYMHAYFSKTCSKLEIKECIEMGLYIIDMYKKIRPIIEIFSNNIILYMQLFNNDCKYDCYETFLNIINPEEVTDNNLVIEKVLMLLWHATYNFWYKSFDRIQTLFTQTCTFLNKLPQHSLTTLMNALNIFINHLRNKTKHNIINSELKKGIAIISNLLTDFQRHKRNYDKFYENFVQLLSMTVTATLTFYTKPDLLAIDQLAVSVGELLLSVPLNCTCSSKTCVMFQFFKLHMNIFRELTYIMETKKVPLIYNQLILVIVRSQNMQQHFSETSCKNLQAFQDVAFQQLYYFLHTLTKNFKEKDFSKELLAFVRMILANDKNIATNWDILTSSVSLLTAQYDKNKEYANGLLVLAIIMAVGSNINVYHMYEWHLMKNGLNSSECVVGFLEKNMAHVKRIHKNFELKTDMRILLLVTELLYKSKYATSKSSILKQIDKLAEIDNFIELLLSEIAATMKFDYDNILLINLIKRYEAVANKHIAPSTKKLKLAFLKYIAYKNAQHSKWKQEVTKIIETESGEDVFDIVTMHTHLQLSKYLEHIKSLKSIFEIVKEQINLPELQIVKNYTILNLLISIIEEFRFNLLTSEYLEACFICLNLAKQHKNWLVVLKTIVLISDIANKSSVELNKLIEEAEICVKNLQGSSEANAILVNYYLCRSKICFELEQFAKGDDFYNRAKSMSTDLNEDAKIEYDLRSTVISIIRRFAPCCKQLPGHKGSLKLKNEFKFNTSWIRKEKCTFIIALYFEGAKYFAEILWWLKVPKELLMHCREMMVTLFSFSQPLQICYGYYFLGQAELLMNQISACQMKIKGIKYTLDLDTKNECSENNDLKQLMPEMKDDIIAMFENLTIQSQCTSKKFTKTSGSPVLFDAPFKLPEYIYHPSDCTCFACMNVEYSILLLAKMYLEILLNTFDEDMDCVEKLFELSQKMYLTLRSKKSSFYKKCSVLYPIKVGPDFDTHLLNIMGILFLEYGNYYFRTNNIKKAQAANDLLRHVIHTTGYNNIHLNLEVSDQRCSILLENFMAQKKIEKLSVESCKTSCKTPEKTSPAKDANTPMIKISKVSVDVPYTPDITIPRKKLGRPKKLESDYENEEFKKPSKPVLMRTPATASKIQVYTDEKPKASSSRKREQLKEMSQNSGAVSKSGVKSKLPKLAVPPIPTIVITNPDTESDATKTKPRVRRNLKLKDQEETTTTVRSFRRNK